MTKEIKLTETQQSVMGWMSKGWPATMNGRSSIEINGKRVCNINTITVLVRAGLVEEDGKRQWKATAAGRAWTPKKPGDQSPFARKPTCVGEGADNNLKSTGVSHEKTTK